MLLSFGSIVYSLGPSMKILSLDLIFPIVPPICWALYQFFTKVVSGDNDPFAAIFYTSILGAIIFSIFIFFNWVPLEKNIYWLYLTLLGVAGFISHSLIIYAIQLSNLSFLNRLNTSDSLQKTISTYYKLIPRNSHDAYLHKMNQTMKGLFLYWIVLQF